MSKIPPSLVHLLAAWNETDTSRIAGLLAKAVTPDVEFVDPNYAIRGVTAFEKMVVEFRTRYPKARCLRMSAIDAHHDRARYHWRVVADETAFIDGMDCVQFDAAGLVARVDGFFGVLKIEQAT
jgi:hypothetical protein